MYVRSQSFIGLCLWSVSFTSTSPYSLLNGTNNKSEVGLCFPFSWKSGGTWDWLSPFPYAEGEGQLELLISLQQVT